MMWRPLLNATILAILVAGVLAKAPAGKPNQAWSGRLDDLDGRLPTDLLPVHYNVEIQPDIYQPQPPFPFSGKVEIIINCVTATDVITLNNDGLTIDEASVSISVSPDTPGSPPEPVLVSWEHVQSLHFLHFRLSSALVAGERYVISMSYTGTMNPYTLADGLYWDFYENESGSTVYIAATQGESLGARQMFPSFDEPDMKATFSLTILRRDVFQSFANTELTVTLSRPDGWLADVYYISPIMSTYQVCFVIGDFVSLFSGNINGYDVRILARPQMISQMQFAANIAAEVQAWLEDMTQQPYRTQFSKMDHIALPNKGGAMENWGLITYGEESMAVNPETSPASAVLNVASIVSHELAHQWYGNLVTCEWWTDIWLNEGFATYYNYYPTVVLGWEAMENQQSDARRGVLQFMDIDCKNNSDPVRKDISHAFLADYSFSGSTYPKGGAMLRMINGILTNDTFVRATRSYLDVHKYQGASTDDLWASLTAQAAIDGVQNPDGTALDMKERMDAWLNQMGYPLITLTRHEDGTATVSQQQFFNPANQIMNTPSPYNYKWHVPLTVATSQSSSDVWDAPPTAWIDIDQSETTITGLPTDLSEWVILNTKGRMYYRVNYDDASRAAINDVLTTNPRAIEAQTKTSFIDDSFALARTGHIQETAAMDSTLYLADEYSYNPWYVTLKHFASAERLIEQELWFASYRAYVLSLTVPVYSTVGWTYYDTETPQQQYLRRDMVSVSCSNGWNDCVDTALSQYYEARDNTAINVVNPNNMPTVLCNGILTFNSDWTLWFNVYVSRKTSQIRDERYAILFGLACTNYQPNLHLYLNELIGPNIASRDKNTAANYLALNNYGAILLWNYLDENWNNAAFSGRFSTLQTIVNGFSGETGLNQLLWFIERHPAQSATEENSYTQMILTVEQNTRWLAENKDALRDWLSVHTAKATPDTLERNMRRRFPVDPIHHWMHLSSLDQDSELY